jgi:hypothetical protein
MRNLMICTLLQILFGRFNQDKGGGQGTSTGGGEKRCIRVFWWGNVRKRGYFEDSGVDWSLILRWIFRKWDGGMEYSDLAQNSDGWWVLVIAVMKLRVPQNTRNF